MKWVWMALKLDIYSWEDAPWSRDLENATVFGHFLVIVVRFVYSFSFLFGFSGFTGRPVGPYYFRV